MTVDHPWLALGERARHDAASPLVTYYDLDSGERMELSATSLLNAAAKAAGLLRDEFDVQPGDRVGLFLPLHWQLPVWFAACSAVGAIVVTTDSGDTPCVVDVVDPTHPAGAAPEAVAAALLRFGLPGREPLPDLGRPLTDQAIAARAHPDDFVPWQPPQGVDLLIDTPAGTETADGVMAEALRRAAELGLGSGGRLLVTGSADLVTVAAVPLAVPASVVLVVGTDEEALTRIRTTEHITAP